MKSRARQLVEYGFLIFSVVATLYTAWWVSTIPPQFHDLGYLLAGIFLLIFLQNFQSALSDWVGGSKRWTPVVYGMEALSWLWLGVIVCYIIRIS